MRWRKQWIHPEGCAPDNGAMGPSWNKLPVARAEGFPGNQRASRLVSMAEIQEEFKDRIKTEKAKKTKNKKKIGRDLKFEMVTF